MSATFWIASTLLVLAALAFVLLPLLRGTSHSAAGDTPLSPRESGGGEGPDKLAALQSARAAGILTDQEYEAKRAALMKAAASAPINAAANGIAAHAAPTGPAGVRGRIAPARRSALLLLVLVPLATFLLYREVGEPRALAERAAAPMAGTQASAEGGAQAPTLEQAAAGLAERMRQSPDDLGGWMLLGRAYKTLQRFGEARDALANAYRLAPDDPDVMVEYAEALTLTGDSPRIEGQAAELLDRALAVQPEHQRGLWLKGIQAYQDEDFAAAAQTWQRLRELLPPEADVRGALDERINDARGKAGLPPLAVAPAPRSEGVPGAGAPRNEGAAAARTAQAAPAAPDPAAGGARLTVTVDIAPELKARLQPTDVLFVFARAPSGPRMPVAIQRLPAAGLPVTVVLDDSTAMTPQLTLSTLPEVVVGARVSHSGNAAAQPGDLEAYSEPVATATPGTLRLVIDTVVE